MTADAADCKSATRGVFSRFSKVGVEAPAQGLKWRGRCMSWRILLVEDDPLVRLALADALYRAGFQVVEAEDGDGAREQLDGPDGFDLLLTDVRMPGAMDGIALAGEARRRDPGIPVVYATGEPELVVDAGHPGAREAMVVKPYDPGEILRVVRGLLRSGGAPG